MLFGAATGAAVLFLVLTSIVWQANQPVGLDRMAERVGVRAGAEGPLGRHGRLSHAAEQLGTRKVVGSTAVVIFTLALVWRDWVAGVVALLSPVLCFGLVEYVAKPAINTPVPFGGRAFPSGHAAGVTAVSVSALILVYRRWGGMAAIAASPFGLVAIVAVGLGVLALSLHQYLTDVLGGVTLGATVPLTMIAVLSFGVSRWPGPRRLRNPQPVRATTGFDQ